MVHYNLSKTLNGVCEAKPKRVASNKTDADVHDKIYRYIDSFPKVESHYCRTSTEREYLESSLNIRQLYSLYVKKHPESPPSETYYRMIFNEEFNLGFHQPSKDMCNTCDRYMKIKNLDEMTPELEQHQEARLRRKENSKSEKEKNKMAGDGVLAVCFDLQQVLPVPRLSAAKAYYKWKLNMYNLTFYEL